MRILFVNRELPYPPDEGGRIRAYSLLRNLAARHEMDLIAFADEDAESKSIPHLKAFCRSITTVRPEPRQLRENKRKYQLSSLFSPRPYHYYTHYSPRMQAAIDNHLGQTSTDLIHVEFAHMGYYRLPNDIPRVLDQHNVEYEIIQRTARQEKLSVRKIYATLEWRKFKRDEIAICRRFDACLTTSERDKRVLGQHLPGQRMLVVPNGVDSDFYQPGVVDAAEDNAIIFVGTIDYFPNIDGLHYFVEEILPLVQARLPDVKLYIVGKDPPPEILRFAQQTGIVITGYVPDTREYYRRAKAVIVPLRIGGGTRLKLVEAMAMGKPVVSTTVGAEGIEITDGLNGLLRDQPQSFAQALITILTDGSVGEQLGRARKKAGGRAL
jgi:polysaccharide biosynthesis protein PslH